MNINVNYHDFRSAQVELHPGRSLGPLPYWTLTITLDEGGELHTLTFFSEDRQLDGFLAGFGWTRASFDDDGKLRAALEVSQ